MADILTHLSRLARCAECPICFERLIPPVDTCQNGHAVCQSCRLLVAYCPTCKSHFTGFKNTSLDQILEVIPVPCKFSLHGCQEQFLVSEIMQHESICYHREESCYFCHKSMAYNTLNKHFDDHKEERLGGYVKLSEVFNFVVIPKTLDGHSDTNFFLVHVSDVEIYFLIRFLYEIETNVLKVLINYFGKVEEGNNFLCKIKIDQLSPNWDVKSFFTITGFCVPYSYARFDWQKHERAITLDLNQIFLTEECPDEFRMSFNIFKK